MVAGRRHEAGAHHDECRARLHDLERRVGASPWPSGSVDLLGGRGPRTGTNYRVLPKTPEPRTTSDPGGRRPWITHGTGRRLVPRAGRVSPTCPRDRVLPRPVADLDAYIAAGGGRAVAAARAPPARRRGDARGRGAPRSRRRRLPHLPQVGDRPRVHGRRGRPADRRGQRRRRRTGLVQGPDAAAAGPVPRRRGRPRRRPRRRRAPRGHRTQGVVRARARPRPRRRADHHRCRMEPPTSRSRSSAGRRATSTARRPRCSRCSTAVRRSHG